MTRAAHELLPSVTEIVVITHHCDVEIAKAEIIIGGHPAPDDGSVRAGERALALAHGVGNDDALLVLLSGGGSALMVLPAEEITLKDLRETADLVMRAGANITELNCVRKHTDRLKGGRLARAAQPARVIALLLSDVTGDALDAIASGPLSPDTTSYADALHVLDTLHVRDDVPRAVVEHLERGVRGEIPDSPRADDPCFNAVTTHIVGNVDTALEGARSEAERLGYSAAVSAARVVGEARTAGTALARNALEVRETAHTQPLCLLSGGETTVTVRGTGKGGRNQELALAAAIALDGTDGITVVSLGTDGIDGPTDAAGAVVDGTTVERARALGLDAHAMLANNDAYTFFAATGDLLHTGPTGTNVTDLQIVVIA
jgi:glycerate-2-kinase